MPISTTSSKMHWQIFFPQRYEKYIFSLFLQSSLNFLPHCLIHVLVFWLRGIWNRSSPTKDWTCIPCIGRQTPHHWTAREVQSISSWLKISTNSAKFQDMNAKSINMDQLVSEETKNKICFCPFHFSLSVPGKVDHLIDKAGSILHWRCWRNDVRFNGRQSKPRWLNQSRPPMHLSETSLAGTKQS